MKIRLVPLSLALASQLLACEEAPQQPEAPPPLAPRDYAAAQRQVVERERVFDEQGNLLPSNETVAGIVLPRGLTPEYTFEHEWYLRSQAKQEQLRAYFGPRLLTGKVERSGMGTVTYVNAQPKDSKQKRFVTVRIGPAPRNRNESEVFISETPMMPIERPSEAESKKQILERMRYAD